MSSIPEEVLEEIGADVEQAVKEIGAKYGMRISFSGFVEADPQDGNGDEIRLEVVPLDYAELSTAARKSSYWKEFLGEEGTDDDAAWRRGFRQVVRRC